MSGKRWRTMGRSSTPGRLVAVIGGLITLGCAAGALHAQSDDTVMPERFAPGVIDTEADEYGPTFTPDGQVVYFVRRQSRRGAESILRARRTGEGWSTPEVVSFSGRGWDKEPYLAPDGSRLYFASTRDARPDAEDPFDLWMVEATDGGWGEPVRLPDGVNSAAYENYPAVDASGTLYFSSRRQGGRNDLYLARARSDGGWEEPVPFEHNTEAGSEADPWISPDGRLMIFSYSGEGSFGEGDLYWTARDADGGWSEPRNLGRQVNTEAYEYTPMVDPAGEWLYFSRGWGELYRIRIADLEAPLPL